MNCRHCKNLLTIPFVDLGFAPPSNAYIPISDSLNPETYYPLKVMICQECWLVQTLDLLQREAMFDHEYAYSSSTSLEWNKHAIEYSSEVISRFNLDVNSMVYEIASNDGYLLCNFVDRSIPCMGIEPTMSTAQLAISKGVPTLVKFFGLDLAKELTTSHGKGNLIIANNVLAHVPEINDFLSGVSKLLAQDGVATFEFPHLLNLIKFNQFDTIYHEHYSYLSLIALIPIFELAGLEIFEVTKLSTHGGSLRLFVCHKGTARRKDPSVEAVLAEEFDFGLDSIGTYQGIQRAASATKVELLDFLVSARLEGKRVAAYGAAAKGNTLLNFCGVDSELIEYVADASTLKQGKLMPGNRIQIVPPSFLFEKPPDFLLVLPWNLASEISRALTPLAENGMRMFVAIPKLREIIN